MKGWVRNLKLFVISLLFVGLGVLFIFLVKSVQGYEKLDIPFAIISGIMFWLTMSPWAMAYLSDLKKETEYSFFDEVSPFLSIYVFLIQSPVFFYKYLKSQFKKN